jgi:hypothetical protein
MACMVDVGRPIANLCFVQESDADMRCVTTFGHWTSCLKFLAEISDLDITADRLRFLLPALTNAVIDRYPGDLVLQNHLISTTRRKIVSLHVKMLADTTGRLSRTLLLFRACRFFNYHFIASTGKTNMKCRLLAMMCIVLQASSP